jgi:hypothetical protein
MALSGSRTFTGIGGSGLRALIPYPSSLILYPLSFIPLGGYNCGMKAVLCRSAALYIFLYQFHLLAADLSEAGLFTVALLGAFASGAALHLLYRRGGIGQHGSDIAAENAPLDCFGTTRLAMTRTAPTQDDNCALFLSNPR